MKINESGRLTSINKYRSNVNARDTKASGTGSKTKDDVQISPEAMELLEAQRSGDASRTQRIEELKSSVQAGTYHVDAQRIAEKLFPFLK